MSSPTFVPVSAPLLETLRELAGAANVITEPEPLETLSKDYYWYSPVLKARLEDRRAAAAVKISSLPMLTAVVAAASKARVPITVRGSATGNYGQCIPLHGGVVLDLSGFDRILAIADGVVTAEPGARLGTIEHAARAVGLELRCYPSTWVKASIGGFFGGGSGGIGSITWGGLAAPGTIHRFKVLTAEETPRLLTLDGRDALKAFHGYGTNGILVEIQMRLAPAYPWDQVVIAGAAWDPVLDFAEEIARDDAVRKRLLTVLEDPIPSFFKPIKKFYPADHHLIFLELESSATAAVKARAEAAGLRLTHLIPHHEPRRAPMLSDYTWNHTTLWAIKADPAFTYVQSGFGENFREQFALLRAKFPGEILLHLEFTRNIPADGSPGNVGLGGIPLVRFSNEARLKELIAYCREIGVYIADPHTCYVDEGWTGADWTAHLALKAEADPHGLLNPGKFTDPALNPFAPGGAGMPKFLFTS